MPQERINELLFKAYEALRKDPMYPESLEIIEDNLPGIDDIPVDAMLAACRLHDADGKLPMHPAVAEFCLEVYFDAYARGDSDAALNLGSLYYTGRAGEQNYAKAVEYYTFAAEKGNVVASENLGYCYYYGRSVEQDYSKAYAYFIKGALAGRVISLYKIGDMYAKGYAVEKDEKYAFTLYTRCLEIMSDEEIEDCGADVFKRVGECLYKGRGTEVDLSTALMFLQRAEIGYYSRIEKGDVFAKSSLKFVIDKEDEIRHILLGMMG